MGTSQRDRPAALQSPLNRSNHNPTHHIHAPTHPTTKHTRSSPPETQRRLDRLTQSNKNTAPQGFHSPIYVPQLHFSMFPQLGAVLLQNLRAVHVHVYLPLTDKAALLACLSVPVMGLLGLMKWYTRLISSHITMHRSSRLGWRGDLSGRHKKKSIQSIHIIAHHTTACCRAALEFSRRDARRRPRPGCRLRRWAMGDGTWKMEER